MLTIYVLTAAFLVNVVTAQTPSFGPCPSVKTQETVDLEKYVGFWYEIEAFPSPFEKNAKCIRARYSPKSNGHIEVFNRDIDITKGTVVNATGDAYRPDPNQQGKLLVKFAQSAPYANYLVLHTDYEQFSLVYSCAGLGVAHIEFAWILSRNLTLDAKIAQELKQELASYKVDTSKFHVTEQSGCPK